jgi:hypothetical protein
MISFINLLSEKFGKGRLTCDSGDEIICGFFNTKASEDYLIDLQYEVKDICYLGFKGANAGKFI